jgi:hypothetical protein
LTSRRKREGEKDTERNNYALKGEFRKEKEKVEKQRERK